MGRPYSELGKVLDQLARSRGVRGPKAIAAYVKEKTGDGPGLSGWGQILHGDFTPTRKTVRLFGEAFELDEEEQTRLALTYVFGEGRKKDASLSQSSSADRGSVHAFPGP
jgi:hypothetical protein